jgi:hypothetical protein
MNTSELLETIRAQRAALDRLLVPLSEAQLCTPTLEGQRSIKDILMHLAAWEQLCAQWIEDFLHGHTPQIPQEDDDTINERVFLANRSRPLSEVQALSSQAYQRLFTQIEALTQTLSEEDLNAPHRFVWTEPWKGHSLVAVIAANSYDHYRGHIQQIRAWIDQAQGQG